MTKNMLTDSLFCYSTSTEATYHRQFGKCTPDSQSFAYRRKYHHLFKQNVVSAHIRKKYTILNLTLVNIWNHKKNLQDLRGQNNCKNVGLV